MRVLRFVLRILVPLGSLAILGLAIAKGSGITEAAVVSGIALVVSSGFEVEFSDR